MVDIFLLNPQGSYKGNTQKSEEYIDRYKNKSTRAIKFAYNTYAAAAGTKMGIKKGIVDLFHRLPPSSIWQNHLVKAMGDRKSLKDVTIHDIIQSIHTNLIKPGSQDTNTGLLKRQSAPQWSKGTRAYIA